MPGKKFSLTTEMINIIVKKREEGKPWLTIADDLGVDVAWLRREAKREGMETGKMNKVKSLIAVLGICAAITACETAKKVDTPQEVLVVARSAYLSSATAFSQYASQPFCDTPDAPQPPLCAERSHVIEGAKASASAVLALDAADAVIKTGGKFDTNVTLTIVERFVALVNQYRGVTK
jgi:hypothetical protein